MTNNVVKKSFGLLVMALVCGVTSGCNRNSGEIIIDKTKTTIRVGVWDGGFRNNWVTTWGDKFSEMYKDVSFEPGKKGVQVVPNLSKDYLDDSLKDRIMDETDEICFSEQTNYYVIKNANVLYDVSEWVKTPLTEFGESKSIQDKMNDTDISYYGGTVNKEATQYYGIPWYVSFNPINYDMQLFDDECFYFAAEGSTIGVDCDSDGFILNENCQKSLGPNGKTGVINGIDYSYDDGLPATYDEFFKLCDHIVDAGFTPFTWAGGMQSYVNSFYQQLVADYEGFDNMKLNYSFDGEALDIVKSIKNGVVELENSIAINMENGYMTKQQAGWYYGLKFLERLIGTGLDVGEPKYYKLDDCFEQTVTHLAAQEKFLRSRAPGNPFPAIAMLIDGTWWYNEATAVFNGMSSLSGFSKQTRRIGIMTMPKADKSRLGDPTLMQSWISTVFVRKNIDPAKVEAIRAFYRFIHTDECLSSYMADSCGIRPFKFDLKGITLDSLPVYVQQQYTLYQNFKTVIPYENNNICKQYLNTVHKNYTSDIAQRQYNLITTAIYEGHTAEEYFAGMKSYWTRTWPTLTKGINS